MGSRRHAQPPALVPPSSSGAPSPSTSPFSSPSPLGLGRHSPAAGKEYQIPDGRFTGYLFGRRKVSAHRTAARIHGGSGPSAAL